MTTVVEFSKFKRYPDINPSRYLRQAISQDGLIEPLLVRDGEIHEDDRERFEAFVRLAESLGTKGVKTIIIVDWEELDDNERAEYR